MEINKILEIMFIGDIIGFKNSDWSTKYNEEKITYEKSLELLFEFISLGGVNNIDIKEWKCSVNPHIIISIFESIKNSNEYNYDEIVKKFKIDFKNIIQNAEHPHGIDLSMILAIRNDFDNKYSINSLEGNGATWCSVIGLFDLNVTKIIEISIRLAKNIYTSPYGFLGGFTAAYFAYLGKRKISVNLWGYKLVKKLKSDKIKKFIDDKNEREMLDYHGYINLWNKYLETRFDNGIPIVTKATSNILFRSKYYYENFAKIINKTKIIGRTGCDACIVAYDSLLDAENVWEKLIVYSMLNPGDTNVIGSLAGGWYSIMYGINNIPNHIINDARNGINRDLFGLLNNIKK